MLILGLSGFAASGKTEIANYLKEKYSFTILEFSQVIEEEAKRMGLMKNNLSLEEKKRVLSEVGAIIRKKYNDEAIFARFLVKKIMEENTERVVVTGFRSRYEVEVFKDAFKENFYLVWVETDVRLRYERRKLQDPNFNLSFEEFLERDENDSKRLGLDKIKDMANFFIENNSTLDDLKKKVDDFIDKILLK
ncbi:MAG: AAA family ATPase [Candidatus Aenigmatarchaeota archaeon]